MGEDAFRLCFHGLRSRLWILSVWNRFQHRSEHKRGWKSSIYPPPLVIPFGHLSSLLHSLQYLLVRVGFLPVPRVFAQQTTHAEMKYAGLSTFPSFLNRSRSREFFFATWGIAAHIRHSSIGLRWLFWRARCMATVTRSTSLRGYVTASRNVLFRRRRCFKNFQWISEEFFLPKVLREKLSFSTLKVNIWPKILESVKKAKLLYDMYLIMANMTVLLPSQRHLYTYG